MFLLEYCNNLKCIAIGIKKSILPYFKLINLRLYYLHNNQQEHNQT